MAVQRMLGGNDSRGHAAAEGYLDGSERMTYPHSPLQNDASAPADVLSTMYAMRGIDARLQVRYVFNKLFGWRSEGLFLWCDEVLRLADVERLTIDQILSLMTTTNLVNVQTVQIERQAIAQAFPNRSDFAKRARERIRRTEGEARTKRLLGGFT